MTNEEKYFNFYHKVLRPLYYEELLNTGKQNANHPIENWARIINRKFTEREMQIAFNHHMRNANQS